MRYAGLALLHGGQAKQHAGQSGAAAAVIETKFSCVTRGVLVVAAILEESPHRPDITVELAAEFHAVAAALPRIGIPDLDRGVPGMHGRCGKSVTDSRVSLDGEPRGTPGVLASKPDSLNAQRANDVVGSVILRSAVHRKARKRKRDSVDSVARKNVVPRRHGLLGQIVEVHAKARQVFRRGGHAAARGEAIFAAGRVPRQKSIAVREIMVHAKGALVLNVVFGADIQVIVGIRGARHPHHVRLGQILQQEAFQKRIDPARRNLIIGKLRASVREIRGPGRQIRVVIRILDGSGWVVDFDIAHAEITLDFVLRGDGQNLGVCLRQAQALIVDEEKSFLSDERAAE